jgi:UDP-N-acetylmuramoyl-L-alanyl-D-glutamate--2,6-diaminopimelate ligase
MKLKNLLHTLNKKEFYGDENIEISSIVIHSKSAYRKSLFVAIHGLKADGHDFLEDAYSKGARAFVTQKPFKRPGAANIIVPDSRAALALLAAEFYNQPSKSLKLIGITGTNGKTTTAFLVESILKEAGSPVGLLSTIEYRFESHTRFAECTTPDQTDLQRLFREMVDAGTRYVVMEVSSHGLKQRRVENCHFDVGVFTNLTPEHLDYHGTMDDYYLSKERFFTEILKKSSKKNKAAVINQDDPAGSLLMKKIKCQTISFGLKKGDIQARNIQLSLTGTKTDIITKNKNFPVTSKLIGTFNLYNILAAIATSMFLKIPTAVIKTGIEKAPGIPGRMERIENDKEILIFVDYAHTGDALENVLKTLKKVGAGKIITVFGCGGDRDREKRPAMGRIAASYSKTVILTSDNPRTEEPEQIINEIEKGVLEKGFSKAENGSALRSREKVYFVFKDRRAAIQNGISLAKPSDVVLIAGKGHETYQQRGDEKIHFDDREEARRALKMCA